MYKGKEQGSMHQIPQIGKRMEKRGVDLEKEEGNCAVLLLKPRRVFREAQVTDKIALNSLYP